MSTPHITVEDANDWRDTLAFTKSVTVTDEETGASSTRAGNTREEAIEKAASDVRAINKALED